MRTVFVTTETNEIPKYVDSYRLVNGADVNTVVFEHIVKYKNQLPQDIDDEVYEKVTAYKPELIVYVGVCGPCTKPSPELLSRFNNEVAPCVLICSDAADEPSPWWPLLREYERKNSFKVMVAIDGNKDWLYHDKHITALTPIDPSIFKPKPHNQRLPFGFAGNIGGYAMLNGNKVGRKFHIDEMVKECGLHLRDRDRSVGDEKKAKTGYQELADFMCNYRITPNFSHTGSYKRMHVKGRVVEAGLAGCLLLETAGSPTRDWFTPNIDYLEYSSIHDVKKVMVKNPVDTEGFGFRLREKVLAEHTPDKFWGRVLERL